MAGTRSHASARGDAPGTTLWKDWSSVAPRQPRIRHRATAIRDLFARVGHLLADSRSHPVASGWRRWHNRGVRGQSGSRRFRVFTCDRGVRRVDVDRDDPARIASLLQEVIESGFWRELARFPSDTLAAALPRLTLARETRRLLEIWIEEKRDLERAA